MVEQKLRLIQRHPDKWPRTEWGRPLPQFEMIRDFVRNMPWRNREEKTTIQAYHKLAWHLECPTKEADCVAPQGYEDQQDVIPSTRRVSHNSSRARPVGRSRIEEDASNGRKLPYLLPDVY